MKSNSSATETGLEQNLQNSQIQEIPIDHSQLVEITVKSHSEVIQSSQSTKAAPIIFSSQKLGPPIQNSELGDRNLTLDSVKGKEIVMAQKATPDFITLGTEGTMVVDNEECTPEGTKKAVNVRKWKLSILRDLKVVSKEITVHQILSHDFCMEVEYSSAHNTTPSWLCKHCNAGIPLGPLIGAAKNSI
ncbi:flagellar P-ring protein [Striga asiatica]|uniref:Flagellar P-ring protein n=1 Tax=Striga asiatica TaxID=4170 RepID=A0A5A7PSK7_STRAF|nr:flagellar P-ring protein [Striga asiatica]